MMARTLRRSHGYRVKQTRPISLGTFVYPQGAQA